MRSGFITVFSGACAGLPSAGSIRSRPAIRLKPFICSDLCIFRRQLHADIDGLQISKNLN